MTVRVALQGFRPFRDFDTNPSELIVQALAATGVDGVELHPLVLTVAQVEARKLIPKFWADVRPDIWLGLGLYDGRPAMSVERFGANLADFFTPDMAGDQPRNELIDPEGPAARRSTVPDAEIVAAWTAAGIPGFASNTAGAYLCNMSLYLAGAENEKTGGTAQVGFLHLPLLPRMVRDPRNQPSMALDEQIRATRLAIEVCAARV